MAMNALSLYVTTLRTLLSTTNASNTNSDLNRLLYYLRSSLQCCVCSSLLVVPMSSTVSSCQHHVCKQCIGGKMKLKPSCSWCKDHSKFIENIQLRILLQLYKNLCQFVLTEKTILQKWANVKVGGVNDLQSSAAVTSNTSNEDSASFTLRELIAEGSNYGDNYSFSEPTHIKSSIQKNGFQSIVNDASTASASTSSSLSSASTSKTVKPSISNAITTQANNAQLVSTTPTTSQSPSATSVSSSFSQQRVKQRRGCRCGLATANPGKLTCCGQRCPCYVEGKACKECKCRGCRNPNKVNKQQQRISNDEEENNNAFILIQNC